MKGFSLLELLIVLLIIGLLGTFSIPFGSEWYQSHFTQLIVQDIKQAIHQAKTTSIMQQTNFRLIPLKPHQWSYGIALIQENTNEQFYVWQWQGVQHVTWHGFLSQEYLRFSPDLNQSALNGYFLIENTKQSGLKVMINRLGRVRTMF